MYDEELAASVVRQKSKAAQTAFSPVLVDRMPAYRTFAPLDGTSRPRRARGSRSSGATGRFECVCEGGLGLEPDVVRSALLTVP